MKSSQYLVTDRTATLFTGPCWIVGIIAQDPFANTVEVHDALGATNPVFKLTWADVGGGANIMFNEPVAFHHGIHIVVTGVIACVTVLIA